MSTKVEIFEIVAFAPPTSLQRSGPRITERSLLNMNSYFELPTISCGGKNLALVNGIESQELGIEPKYSSKLVTLSIRIALEGDSISPITMLSEPRSEMVATEARHFHSPLWLLRDILSIEKMYSAPGTYVAGFVHL